MKESYQQNTKAGYTGAGGKENSHRPHPDAKGTTLDLLRDRGVTKDPLSRRRLTTRPDAWTGPLQDPSEYLTTQQLADSLNLSPSQVVRWCHRWYGVLPESRKVKGQGYRIHPSYIRVARAWLQTEDTVVREAARKALAESPRDFVVVVANRGSTHYSVIEAMRRVESILPVASRSREPVSVMYVGPDQEKPRA